MKHIWSPWRKEYINRSERMKDCIFCRFAGQDDDAANLIVMRGERAFVILNRYPYTNGHLMVVPFTHRATIEELDAPTRAELMELVTHSLSALRKLYNPDGFNIGINIGASAGAGITEHVHMHVVPRWAGDTNFMTALGETRVLPETLDETLQRMVAAW